MCADVARGARVIGWQMQSGALNEAKGFVFISHKGVDRRPLSQEPIFVSLRDTNNLKGKCGVCEFRELCGGSRSRAWSVTGDVFASDPICTYLPAMAATA